MADGLHGGSSVGMCMRRTYLEGLISKLEAWVANIAFTFSGSRVNSISVPNTVYVKIKTCVHDRMIFTIESSRMDISVDAQFVEGLHKLRRAPLFTCCPQILKNSGQPHEAHAHGRCGFAPLPCCFHMPSPADYHGRDNFGENEDSETAPNSK